MRINLQNKTQPGRTVLLFRNFGKLDSSYRCDRAIKRTTFTVDIGSMEYQSGRFSLLLSSAIKAAWPPLDNRRTLLLSSVT